MDIKSFPVERVRGARDLEPDRWATVTSACQKLAGTYASFGYRGVDVPILEHTELYRRKAGASVMSEICSFADRTGRSICLRPEFTASIVRLYASEASQLATPARLHYSGPAFRYEKPTGGAYRQFTESGVELIGVDGSAADAEVIELATASLTQLGIPQFDVVLGHLGILSEFLIDLGLSERSESLLREGMTSLRRSNPDVGPLRAKLEQSNHNRNADPLKPAAEQLDEIFERVPNLGQEDVRQIIATALAGIEMTPSGSRPYSEIVDGLLAKVTRSNEAERISRALDFIERLTTVVDRPNSAFKKTRSLLADFGLSSAPLDHVEDMFVELDAAGVDTSHFYFNPALGRGLQYYSDTVFEIFAPDATSGVQICGGGRYDDLVEILSGPPSTPAVGFTFGVEALLIAMNNESSVASQNPSHVLVTTTRDNNHAYAAKAASILRSSGLRVERDLNGLEISSNLEVAKRMGTPILVIVGDVQSESGKASFRVVETGEERTVTLDILADEVWATICKRKS